MDIKPSSNPYETPKISGTPNVLGSAEVHWSRGPFFAIILTCFIANFLLVLFANFLLKDMLEELAVELPVLSQIAFSFVDPWFVASAILLIFAILSVSAKTLLNFKNRFKAFIYSFLVLGFWILFTIAFAFAILGPLFKITASV